MKVTCVTTQLFSIIWWAWKHYIFWKHIIKADHPEHSYHLTTWTTLLTIHFSQRAELFQPFSFSNFSQRAQQSGRRTQRETSKCGIFPRPLASREGRVPVSRSSEDSYCTGKIDRIVRIVIFHPWLCDWKQSFLFLLLFNWKLVQSLILTYYPSVIKSSLSFRILSSKNIYQWLLAPKWSRITIWW